ncbi:MAG: triose-phosphate isomerase [Andreesenia angusta]|nr:triose-phosphate isomerase [Andreesenia angusta]
MRKPLIAGNWKMNKTVSESIDFINSIKDIKNDCVEGLVCVPYTSLTEVKKSLEGSDIKLGAQNMHYEDNGAYTGEISPLMLKDIGVEYVIIGHSERREYYNETDQTVNKKVKKAFEIGIKPIVCVGESLEERESKKTEEKIKKQIEEGLKDLKEEDLKDLVIAYEPIWAIGTGKTATSDQANDTIKFIRESLKSIYGDVSEKVRIQYGGSVKPENIKELMSKSDIDGALVGGASLKKDDFEALINY